MSIESRLTHHKSLKDLTTFGIGGPARLFIEVTTPEEMAEVRRFINREKIPYWIIGRGSNSLFDDRGFDGLVVLNSIRFCVNENGLVHVGAGYNFSLLGTQMAREGWGGLEFASGIPGSVGGAIFMNAGANGVETCTTLVSVGFINQEGRLIEKTQEELEFSYRFSTFQKTKDIIVFGSFQLQRSESARKTQLEIIKKRTTSQPYKLPSAGCIFRNPNHEKKAGALIEACGLKGKRIGGAEVSSLHANFIVNVKEAKAKDVLDLAAYVQNTVKEKTGVELEMEVRPIPYKL